MCKVYFASSVMKYAPHGFASVQISELNMRRWRGRRNTSLQWKVAQTEVFIDGTGRPSIRTKIVRPSGKFQLDIYCI